MTKTIRDLDGAIVRNSLGRYCVPTSSIARHCASVVARGQVFEPHTIEFLTRHMGGGDIVHAGTFFGDFLPALSHAAAPGATVWAFEPSSENYVCAAITCQLNSLSNVRLQRLGLGERPHTAHLRTVDGDGQPLGEQSWITTKPPPGKGEMEDISIVRLDDVIPKDRRISVIHLDVEGHEQPALAGALGIIERCRPILVLETVPDAEWIARYLTPLGYKVRAGVHSNTVFSVSPVASPMQRARLAARNAIKNAIPASVRHRLRAIRYGSKGEVTSATEADVPAFVVDGLSYRVRSPA